MARIYTNEEKALNPSHIRAEWIVFGFRVWDFLRISGFGFRI